MQTLELCIIKQVNQKTALYTVSQFVYQEARLKLLLIQYRKTVLLNLLFWLDKFQLFLNNIKIFLQYTLFNFPLSQKTSSDASKSILEFLDHILLNFKWISLHTLTEH